MPLRIRLRISTGPQAWICAAPGCLPNPTTPIFVQPLSIGPLKQVCGLMRLTGMIRSAPAALRSRYSGMPSAVRATSTVSIVARISQPMASSVIPSDSSIARWPSAVAPPWLPIAGTTNGSAPRSRSPLIAPRSKRDSLDEPSAAGADGDGHARRDRAGQPLDDLAVRGCLDIGDRLGLGKRELDLGELGYREIGMEWKVDSFEQLFPRVHVVDANRCAAIVAKRHNGVGGTCRRRVSDPSRAAHRRRCGVVDRDAIRWPRRSTCEHLRHGGDRDDRRRARRARSDRTRQGPGRGGSDDHCLVGRFTLAVPQPGDGLGSGVGTPRRGRQTTATAAPGDAPVGLRRSQAPEHQTTCCRAQASRKPAVDRRMTAAQNMHSPAAETSRTRQSVLHPVHPITTESEPVAHSVSIRYCRPHWRHRQDKSGVGSDGHHTDAIRSRAPGPADQRQRQSGAQAPAAPDCAWSSLLGVPLMWFWYREFTGNPVRAGIPPLIRDSPELAMLGLMLVMITGMMMIPLMTSGKSPHTMLRPSDSTIRLADVVGADATRREAIDTLNLFLNHETFAEEMGGSPRRGVLFEGAPGHRQDLPGQGDRCRGRSAVPVRVGQRVPVALLRHDQPQDPPVLQGAAQGRSCRGRRDRVHRGVRRHRHGAARGMGRGGMREGAAGIVNELLVQMQSFDLPTGWEQVQEQDDRPGQPVAACRRGRCPARS